MHLPSLTLPNPTPNQRSRLCPRWVWVSRPNPGVIGSCGFSPRALEPLDFRKYGGCKTGIRCEVEGVGDVGKDDDGFYMRRCVELARRAVGCTSPNPMVGCVIVRDGVVVGEGLHPKAGQPHAEVFALRDAGKRAESATAYVSLEPCNHYGRTPPCTEALINAKVTRVVVGMVDPNPIVASKGVERHRGSGISVTVGVEEMLCQKLNEAYIHKMLTGKPFVTLRYSPLLNDGIIREDGKGAKDPGGYYSQLLQENDGLVISSSSLINNTGLPYSQETGAKQPLLIIISSGKRSPLHIPTFSMESGTRAVVFVDKNTVIEPATESNIKRQAVEVVVLDRVNFRSILDYCSHQGMYSLLLDICNDNGAYDEVFEDLEDGVQKVVMEIPPVWGETEEISVLKLGRKTLTIKDMHSKTVKEHILVEGYVS